MARYLILALVILGTAACRSPGTSTPDLVATQIAVEAAAHATMTAQAPVPMDTPDAVATLVAQARAADATLTALAPAALPTATASPTRPAVLAPSPSAKPKPTSVPIAQIQATPTTIPGPKPTAMPRIAATSTAYPPPSHVYYSTPTATPAPKPTGMPTAPLGQQLLADSLADFGGSHGQKGWEYLSARRDSFHWAQMPFDGSCFYEDPHTHICADQATPGELYDVAWLYRVETGGHLTFRLSVHKANPAGDDVEVGVYRFTKQLHEWLLAGGDTEGFVAQFEQDAPTGELFFFTLHIRGAGRGMVYDPNPVRIEVFLRP